MIQQLQLPNLTDTGKYLHLEDDSAKRIYVSSVFFQCEKIPKCIRARGTSRGHKAWLHILLLQREGLPRIAEHGICDIYFDTWKCFLEKLSILTCY